MKRIAIALACAVSIGLVAVTSFADDKRQAKQMTVEQMQAQVMEARTSHRDVIVHLKSGDRFSGEIQETTANGFSLNQTKNPRVVWLDYTDVQAVKEVSPIKQTLKFIGLTAMGAVVVGAVVGLAAWVALLIANQ
jgi:hypothetical protein